MDVYFDTNIFSHIYTRHRISGAGIKTLEGEVGSGVLRIFTSLPVLEETNAARLTDLDQANGRLELIRTLTVQRQIIKHHSHILRDDVQAYANGETLPTKFQEPYPGMHDLFWDHTAKNYKTLDKAAKDTNDRVSAFKKDMNDTFNNKIRPLVKEAKKRGEQQTFPDYWNHMAEPWVEVVADKYGFLKECKARGLGGLLDVHSVRMNTIAQLSLTFANTYEKGGFDRGNSRDMHHVICASAIPIFVTDDEPLTKVLARMPPPNLEVIDLPTLIKRL